MNTEEAAARLRDLCGDGSLDDYWPSVRLGDIRAILDERDALLNKAATDKRFIATEKRFTNKYIKLHREVRKERDALRERLEAAELVVNAAREILSPKGILLSEKAKFTYLDALAAYDERFGGRDE